jgi:hypothetical protein
MISEAFTKATRNSLAYPMSLESRVEVKPVALKVDSVFF